MSKRRQAGMAFPDLAAPFRLQLAAWTYGMKLLEMNAKAAAVITRRSTMLAHAMLDPPRLADPEFSRMVMEKAEAAGEAFARVARHAATPTATDAMALAASSLALAESCLVPYSRRVKANARRLGNGKSARRW